MAGRAGPLLRALNASLRAAGALDDPRDASIVQLARTYARLIDDAEQRAATAAAALAPREPGTWSVLDVVHALELARARVAARETVSTLGPKLLAQLVALRLAPAQPTKATPPRPRPAVPAAPAAPDAGQVLDMLRRGATDRRHRAGG